MWRGGRRFCLSPTASHRPVHIMQTQQCVHVSKCREIHALDDPLTCEAIECRVDKHRRCNDTTASCAECVGEIVSCIRPRYRMYILVCVPLLRIWPLVRCVGGHGFGLPYRPRHRDAVACMNLCKTPNFRAMEPAQLLDSPTAIKHAME